MENPSYLAGHRSDDFGSCAEKLLNHNLSVIVFIVEDGLKFLAFLFYLFDILRNVPTDGLFRLSML